MISPAREIALAVSHADSAATVLRFDSLPAGFRLAVLHRLRLTFRRIHLSLNPFLPVSLAGGLTLFRSPA